MGADDRQLKGFERRALRRARPPSRRLWTGSGPAVIVIAEIPGITPKVIEFARRVAARGMTVAMPHLFGDDGREPTTGYLLRSISSACVSREFTVLATRRSSPVVEWLRALARHAHERCGGPGVGVVGMCLTGGFALADDGRRARRRAGALPALAAVLDRGAPRGGPRLLGRGAGRGEGEGGDGTKVLGLRFTGDPAVKPARFASLRRELGDGFLAVELDSSPGNPYGHRKGAHSVLTEDLIDREGSPTMAALAQVLDFLAAGLGVAAVA